MRTTYPEIHFDVLEASLRPKDLRHLFLLETEVGRPLHVELQEAQRRNVLCEEHQLEGRGRVSARDLQHRVGHRYELAHDGVACLQSSKPIFTCFVPDISYLMCFNLRVIL